jgi:hypothetical protein
MRRPWPALGRSTSGGKNSILFFVSQYITYRIQNNDEFHTCFWLSFNFDLSAKFFFCNIPSEYVFLFVFCYRLSDTTCPCLCSVDHPADAICSYLCSTTIRVDIRFYLYSVSFLVNNVFSYRNNDAICSCSYCVTIIVNHMCISVFYYHFNESC